MPPREPRRATRLVLALGLAASVLVCLAPAATTTEEDAHDHDHSAHSEKGARASTAGNRAVKLSEEEQIWQAFVQHVESLGESDLLPGPEENEQPLSSLDELI